MKSEEHLETSFYSDRIKGHNFANRYLSHSMYSSRSISQSLMEKINTESHTCSMELKKRQSSYSTFGESV